MAFQPPSSAQKSLDLVSLRRSYQTGAYDPEGLLLSLAAGIRAAPDQSVWIHVCSDEQIKTQLSRSAARQAQGIAQPLFGAPFAVKDNIDVAGCPTTAACPAYSYTPEKSAAVVQRLCDAGAIAMGKTNLDQFAAGLVGTRSPYGACRNPFNPAYISGGSSSGSAVAVALGQVSFALGTDTAGSGRVPAAFNNIVGLKPSCGMISAAGVVPACQSLDCVSIFALTCEDASTILKVAEEFDSDDPYSRRREELPPRRFMELSKVRVGIPRADQLEFFGDDEAKSLYRAAIERIKSIGGTVSEIDYQPFLDAAALLYAGPWLAERYLVVEGLIERDPSELFPVTQSVLARGADISATDTFAGLHQLRALGHKAYAQLAKVDLLLLPSAGTTYTIEQVNADPIHLNTNLGYYTNFVNLLDLAALAVPGGFKRSVNVPLGVTLIGHAGTESAMLQIGSAMHRALGIGPGVAQMPLAPQEPFSGSSMKTTIHVAVLGAHLSGMPLNHQMTERGAKLVRATRTAPIYRFYALPNTTPPKPGMVRVADEPGHKIDLEVWEMPLEAYGSFIAGIGAPLGIGTIQLEDGQSVQGFLCESYAVKDAADISKFGGWRAYVASLGKK